MTNIIKSTMATGSVVPRQEVEIKPKVSGIIEELYVEPGEHVKEGDLIARIKIIPDMVNLNNAQSRLNRITSYNVCYTKLLRHGQGTIWTHVAGGLHHVCTGP